jgi:uncharacterized membrane protein YfcA
MDADALMILFGLLGLITAIFTCFFLKDMVAHKDEKAVGANGGNSPLWLSGIIGAVTSFFDTLGIGSFAPTTALFKATKVVDDEVIPGTLNVSHTLPVVYMAFMYINSVEVELLTLVSLIMASAIGSFFGAGIVAKFNKRTIQFIIGIALLVTALVMTLRTLGFISGLGTGDALGLSGGMLIIGIVAHLILGALMSAGVGLYAPSMAVVFMLGLSPTVAFPIMMGACAFLMPVAGIKFIKEGKYARKQSLAIGILGIPGVWLAIQFFEGLDITMLTWMVIAVIIFTSLTMLNAYMKSKSDS